MDYNSRSPVRWHPFKNTLSTTIPPFACMELSDSTGAALSAGGGGAVGGTASSLLATATDAEGNCLFTVKQPTTVIIDAKTSARICFNSSQAVKPGLHGALTFETPVQALIDSLSVTLRHDPRRGGLRYGPKVNSWGMSENPFGAFRLISDDKSNPTGQNLTVWVVSQDAPGSFVGRATSAGVSARNGTTLGSGSAQIWYVSGTTLTQLLTVNSVAIAAPVRNLSTFPIAGDEFFGLHLDESSGNWFCEGKPRGNTLLIKNDEQSDIIPQYGILGIQDQTPDPGADLAGFKNAAALVGVIPLTCNHYGRFAIAQADINPQATGPCVAAGVSQCKVDITNADHEWCDVKDGEFRYLESRMVGSCRILTREDNTGTGQQWCIVRIGDVAQETWEFVLNEDMGATTAGEAEAELTDFDGNATGIIVQVEDSPSARFAAMTASKTGTCVRTVIGATCRYIIIQGDCP